MKIEVKVFHGKARNADEPDYTYISSDFNLELFKFLKSSKNTDIHVNDIRDNAGQRIVSFVYDAFYTNADGKLISSITLSDLSSDFVLNAYYADMKYVNSIFFEIDNTSIKESLYKLFDKLTEILKMYSI